MVALIALLVAYFGYRWLKAQIPVPPVVQGIDLTREGERGYTRMRAGGAAAALAADVERHHGVESARARLTSDRRAPEAELRASVFDSVDVPELMRHIGETSLERLRSMLDADSLRRACYCVFGTHRLSAGSTEPRHSHSARLEFRQVAS